MADVFAFADAQQAKAALKLALTADELLAADAPGGSPPDYRKPQTEPKRAPLALPEPPPAVPTPDEDEGAVLAFKLPCPLEALPEIINAALRAYGKDCTLEQSGDWYVVKKGGAA